MWQDPCDLPTAVMSSRHGPRLELYPAHASLLDCAVVQFVTPPVRLQVPPQTFCWKKKKSFFYIYFKISLIMHNDKVLKVFFRLQCQSLRLYI